MIRNPRKTRIGLVISDKSDKTVIVAFEWRQRDPLYRKSVRRITRFHAHDEQNTCRVGDQVRILETRPISKTKRWRVVEVLARGEVLEVKPIGVAAALEAVVQAVPVSPVAEVVVEPEPDTEEEVKGN